MRESFYWFIMIPCTMRTTKKIYWPFILLGLWSLIQLGCSKQEKLVIQSSDGAFQLTVSQGMTSVQGLNEQASIQAANEYRELYVIVLTHSKNEFAPNFTLEEFDKHARIPYSDSIGAKSSPVNQEITINNQRALIGQLDGKSGKYPVTILFVSIETEKHFHQLITWTLADRFSKYEETLNEIVHSFHQVESSPDQD